MDRNKEAFEKFIDVLKEVTKNDIDVIKLIEKRYFKANPHYTSSSQFLHLVHTVQRKVQHDEVNKYIFVKELCDELKAYDEKHARTKRKHLRIDSDSDSSDSVQTVKNNVASTSRNQLSVSRKRGADNDTLDNIPETKKSRLNEGESRSSNRKDEIRFVDFGNASKNTADDIIEIESSSSGVVDSAKENGDIAPKGDKSDEEDQDILEIMDDDANDGDSDSQAEDKEPAPSTSSAKSQEPAAEIDPSVTPKRAKKIVKYQHFLQRLEKRIQRLEEKEISVDEMEEDSNYLVIDKLKKTFVKHWKRLCELQSRNPSTGRPIDRKFKCQATRFPEINKRIQKFINKKKVFPDYHDVLSIVKKCNERYKLAMNKGMIDMVSRDAFTVVGNQLQQRRREDYDCAFGSHLTDAVRDYDDPALYDTELRRKLESNQKQSKTNLDELIKKFAYKQETEGDKSGEENENDEDEESIMKEEEEKLSGGQSNQDDIIDHKEMKAGHESDDGLADKGRDVCPSQIPPEQQITQPLSKDENLPVTKESDVDKKQSTKAISQVLSDNTRTLSGSNIRDKKRRAKYSLASGPNTISLKDVLGGPILTKEDVYNDAENKLVESEDGRGNSRVNQNENCAREEHDTDDDDVEVIDEPTVPDNVLRRKPVSSPRAREGLLKLKQLKQPDILLGHVTKEQVNVASMNVLTGPTSVNSAIELSSEEDNVTDGFEDLGCRPLDPKQKEYGTPFRRESNSKQKIHSNSPTESISQRVLEPVPNIINSPVNEQVSSCTRRVVPSTVVSYANKSAALEKTINQMQDLSGGKQISNANKLAALEKTINQMKVLSGGKQISNANKSAALEKTINQMKDLSGGKQTGIQCIQSSTDARNRQEMLFPRPMADNSSATQSSKPKQSNSPYQQPGNKQQPAVASHRPVDEPVVIIDDDELDNAEPIVDLSSPAPCIQSSHHLTKPKNREMNGATITPVPPSSTNYTYKKVETVVRETSVSSSSNPQTVVHSSKKTVIRQTPMDSSTSSNPIVYTSTTKEKTTVEPGTLDGRQLHQSGGQGMDGRSAPAGFKLTRRKTKKSNNVNFTHSDDSMISEQMRKEVHKVVTQVLEDNPAPQLPGKGPLFYERQNISFHNKEQHNGKNEGASKVHLHPQTGNQHLLPDKLFVGRTHNVTTNAQSGQLRSVNTMQGLHKAHSSLQQNVPGKQHQNVLNRAPGVRVPLATLSEMVVGASPSPQPQDVGNSECVVVLSDSD